MPLLPFIKYSGTGNDFIIVDNRDKIWVPEDLPLSRLCHRQLGIGADGIIFIENSSAADAKMRIFNSDGSEAEMCGNGLRCIADVLSNLIQKKNLLIESKFLKHQCFCSDSFIQAEMGAPSEVRWDIPLEIQGKIIPIAFLNTGVPHVVAFFEEIDFIDVDELGSYIRHHPLFKPHGSNANFVQKTNEGIKIRTFERGVEGETLACGTGAVASALAAAKIYMLPSPVNVFLKSGEFLKIDFIESNFKIINTFMTGKCSKIFEGQISF